MCRVQRNDAGARRRALTMKPALLSVFCVSQPKSVLEEGWLVGAEQEMRPDGGL